MKLFEDVLKEYPGLNIDGIGIKDSNFDSLRARLEKSKERVIKFAKYLEFFPVRKNIIKDYSSYGMKHSLEEIIGKYVSNGEFIAACIMRGGKILRCREDSLNCFMNISFSKKLLREFKESLKNKERLSAQ